MQSTLLSGLQRPVPLHALGKTRSPYGSLNEAARGVLPHFTSEVPKGHQLAIVGWGPAGSFAKRPLLQCLAVRADRPSRPPPPPLPPGYSLDPVTAYIYRHFAFLLSAEELAAENVRIQRAKQLMYADPAEWPALEFSGMREVEAKYPAMMLRIKEHGPAFVMRAAAERVLRDNPDKQILQHCARCGVLLLTPKARFCMACGFSWHPGASE